MAKVLGVRTVDSFENEHGIDDKRRVARFICLPVFTYRYGLLPFAAESSRLRVRASLLAPFVTEIRTRELPALQFFIQAF